MAGVKNVALTVFSSLLTILSLMESPSPGTAGSPARLIPIGNASAFIEDKVVAQYHAETSLPEGFLILCDGSCIVQGRGFQLTAHDKAIFAAAQSDHRWDIVVKKGRVDFGIASGAEALAFHTPQDVLEIEHAAASADTAGLIRGNILVGEGGTELAIQEGMLTVITQSGRQVVQSGRSILIAQSDGSTGAVVETGTADLSATSLAVGGAAMSTIAGSHFFATTSSNRETEPVSNY
jgi:hypothetical protein